MQDRGAADRFATAKRERWLHQCHLYHIASPQKEGNDEGTS